jgi:hypothetical protein
MAALVDYTALVESTGFKDGYPQSGGEPVDGIGKDYWRRVRLDFSKTNLTDADWAKIMVIPAHTYVMDLKTYIVTIQSTATTIYIGDANADHSETYETNVTGAVADVVSTMLVADTVGATRGKYYHAAGALYLSATVTLTTLVIDVYVHCMNMNPDPTA